MYIWRAKTPNGPFWPACWFQPDSFLQLWWPHQIAAITTASLTQHARPPSSHAFHSALLPWLDQPFHSEYAMATREEASETRKPKCSDVEVFRHAAILFTCAPMQQLTHPAAKLPRRSCLLRELLALQKIPNILLRQARPRAPATSIFTAPRCQTCKKLNSWSHSL